MHARFISPHSAAAAANVGRRRYRRASSRVAAPPLAATLLLALALMATAGFVCCAAIDWGDVGDWFQGAAEDVGNAATKTPVAEAATDVYHGDPSAAVGDLAPAATVIGGVAAVAGGGRRFITTYALLPRLLLP
ncbi:hypothetical protein PLESTB_001797000 [Pleodorina starrii]|uniref:Uncharacterized protein n=1 Tax=Pleodorina starrii TaxID=330485 RepID=A0A9W6C0P7_9CHLO|nr:hypothetical protein PLESTM_001161400 [Pleodorina starrii]GLC61733.1 hypothetical protein PLESTB_001797000 [Pleodorina starrii]GLC69213.1 hypothetical protein PLESTF_000802700 [Pleodorina starrii]